MSAPEQPELVIVIPVFNEEASIQKVFCEWDKELRHWTQTYHFLLIDDGSTDKTSEILEGIRQSSGSSVTVLSHKNAGHGQTCLKGYQWAVQHNARYVLQLDSDGQCDPKFFGSFWSQRENFEVISGERTVRDDGMFRTLASRIVRIVVRLVSHVDCRDCNVPYRLMQTHALARVIGRIPADFHLANIALAVLLHRTADIRHGYVPIRFRQRYGGQPSVRLQQFAYRAFQLIRQLKRLD